jgi:hypothetical protein
MAVFGYKRDRRDQAATGWSCPQAFIANLQPQENAKTSSPPQDMSHNERKRP